MTDILTDVAVKILSNRIKIIDSYKITDRDRMKQIIYAIQYNHPEVKFNRDINDLVHEWVAHNKLYKWKIKRNMTKDVDLEYEEKWYYRLIYKMLDL